MSSHKNDIDPFEELFREPMQSGESEVPLNLMDSVLNKVQAGAVINNANKESAHQASNPNLSNTNKKFIKSLGGANTMANLLKISLVLNLLVLVTFTYHLLNPRLVVIPQYIPIEQKSSDLIKPDSESNSTETLESPITSSHDDLNKSSTIVQQNSSIETGDTTNKVSIIDSVTSSIQEQSEIDTTQILETQTSDSGQEETSEDPTDALINSLKDTNYVKDIFRKRKKKE